MVTTGLERETTLLRPAPRQRSGIIDRVLLLVDRLPGPAAAWWAGIGVAIAVAGHVAYWLTNSAGTFAVLDDIAAPALIFAWFAWLTHLLNETALASYDEFAPALGDPGADDRYRAGLTSIHDGWAVIAAVSAIVVVSIGYFVGVRPLRESVPPDIERISAPLWGLASAALGVTALHTVTQLRLVSRLSAIARNVDIFKPAPINALSRLTAVNAGGLIAFVVAFVLISREQPVAYIVEEAALMAIAAVSFVLPLRVMHQRLSAEQKRLKGEA